ncbi:MAG: signal recognition particle receptor subunit alpha, partial [Bacteroidales bacterium]
MAFFGLFGKKSEEEKKSLDQGLQKTKTGIFDKISRAIVGKSKVDDDVLDAIEEALVASDIGVDTTLKIIDSLQERVARDKFMNTDELHAILREEIENLLHIERDGAAEPQVFDFTKKPYVIMVVGVNGVGKTTTIGKLALRLKNSGKKVVLGAADTFRAAAVEQLVIWSERAGVPIVKQGM